MSGLMSNNFPQRLREQRLLSRERLAQHCAKMFRDVEAAANAYAKERTLENANRLYQALYGTKVRRLCDDGGTYNEKCNRTSNTEQYR